MNEKDFLEIIQKIIVDILKKDISNILYDTNITEIGFDSITYIQLLVYLEEIYNIEFEDEFILYRKNIIVADIIEALIILLNKKNNRIEVELS